MSLHFVSSFETIHKFKKSRYFRNNLGLVATVENNGKRTYNEKDKFSFFYNNRYRTTIYAQGNIGDIKFYTDHYIKDSTFAAFHGDNFEEFLFKFNDEIEMIKGIDFYLGKVIKEVEENTKKK